MVTNLSLIKISIGRYLESSSHAAPLAILRMFIGLMILISLVRFWAKGWIYDLYIKPAFYFPFYGFEWVRPLGSFTYLLFMICAFSALMVMLGWYYRWAIVSLFLSFTYIELIDKSTYLNHYYFIGLLCFVLIFLPAHVYFSVDSYRNKNLRAMYIPRWCVDALRLLVFILYFFAGLAKINSDWLLEALPLKIWLPARNDMPVIGFLFNKEWVAYLFSWIGCIYDLSIVFLLLHPKTRIIAYITVIIFHGLTAVLFPIGMFPYVMIVAALIFFPSSFHQKLITFISSKLRLPADMLEAGSVYQYPYAVRPVLLSGFAVFFLFQLLFPFRYLLYPSDLFWSEQGYRFSWRVMLMEKAGYAQFMVKDASGKQVVVNNNQFLTTLQEKMMATQPDMMLQYAHMLKEFYSKQGFDSPQVFVDSYVALNGRLGKPMVDPGLDLAAQTDSFLNKSWILPVNNEIKEF